MFFGKFIKEEIAKLTREVRSAHNKIFEDVEYLTQLVRSISIKIKNGDSDLSSAIDAEDCASASVEIDFRNMDVFSIERKMIEGQPCTIIGYWDLSEGTKKCKEWSLFCDKGSHERLICEFRAHKEKQTT